MNKIWIVYGAQGQYSDASEWTVCACLTEEKAIEIRDELRRRLDILLRTHGESGGYYNYQLKQYIEYDETLYLKEIDPYFDGFDQPAYNYYECEIR